MGELDVRFDPTEKHFEEIRMWLQDERDQHGESFLCNWNVIESCYQDGAMSCAIRDDRAVAFLVWERYEKKVELHILNVRKNLQRTGVGHELAEHTLDRLRGDGVVVVQGECMPPTSEPFWKDRMGFDASPPDPLSAGKIRVFRRLVPHREPAEDGSSSLRLWNVPPWDADKANSESLTWDLGEKAGDGWHLDPPILHPYANHDWCVEIQEAGQTLFKDKLKYAFEAAQRYRCPGYLFVDSLRDSFSD